MQGNLCMTQHISLVIAVPKRDPEERIPFRYFLNCVATIFGRFCKKLYKTKHAFSIIQGCEVFDYYFKKQYQFEFDISIYAF